MKLLIKIFLISIIFSCSISWGFKNYKNPLLALESSSEIASESKEKTDNEKEDSFANLNSENILTLNNSLGFIAFYNQQKPANYSREIPTSPPDFSS